MVADPTDAVESPPAVTIPVGKLIVTVAILPPVVAVAMTPFPLKSTLVIDPARSYY